MCQIIKLVNALTGRKRKIGMRRVAGISFTIIIIPIIMIRQEIFQGLHQLSLCTSYVSSHTIIFQFHKCQFHGVGHINHPIATAFLITIRSPYVYIFVYGYELELLSACILYRSTPLVGTMFCSGISRFFTCRIANTQYQILLHRLTPVFLRKEINLHHIIYRLPIPTIARKDRYIPTRIN